MHIYSDATKVNTRAHNFRKFWFLFTFYRWFVFIVLKMIFIINQLGRFIFKCATFLSQFIKKHFLLFLVIDNMFYEKSEISE